MSSHHCDQVYGSSADTSSTLDSPIRPNNASILQEGLTPPPVPSIALVAPSEAGIMEEAMATPFDSILDLELLSPEVTPSSLKDTCCPLPASDKKRIEVIYRDAEEGPPRRGYSMIRFFYEPFIGPSPESTDSFDIDGSVELSDADPSSDTPLFDGPHKNSLTIIFPSDVTDPGSSSEHVGSNTSDFMPPPSSYDEVECTSPACSDEAEVVSKPLSSETANTAPTRRSMLPKLLLPTPVAECLEQEHLGHTGSEEDDLKHVPLLVEKDSDSGLKKPVMLGKLLHVTSDGQFFPNLGTGKLEAWLKLYNPSFVSHIAFRTSIKTTWRDFMEPTMGVIPPRGSKTIVAHADPSKHPKDIGKSLANEVIKLELFPTPRIATKFSEFFSLWKKYEGPVEIIQLKDFSVSSTPRKVEVPTTVNQDGLLMNQNGNKMEPHVGAVASPGDKKVCKTSGIPTLGTRKPVSKDIGESVAAALAPMTQTTLHDVCNEDSEFKKVEEGTAANDGGATTANETSAYDTSNGYTEQVSAELPAPENEDNSKSWSWFRSWF